jgi:diphosphomevalonate decarboxylase
VVERIATAVGTPNIALIKYWGKRDDRLILPMNSSVSMTLDEQLNTRTSVLFSEKLQADTVYINGTVQDINGTEVGERMVVLDILRGMAGDKRKALVVSNNQFPTGSGLASSASGLATLTYAAAGALGLELQPRELSMVARRGSGSACRSMMGGIVEWRKGDKPDGSDSYAEQIIKPGEWPELVDVMAILTESRKKVSSRAGMKQTVQTGILYRSRLDYVEGAVERAIDAMRKRDFQALGELIMRDSMNMHATMLDTWPPIMYLDDSSKEIIYKVQELNQSEGRIVGAYTFDAGSNANIIALEKDVGKITDMLEGLGSVKNILKLKMGNGPRRLGDGESLIDGTGLKPVA